MPGKTQQFLFIALSLILLFLCAFYASAVIANIPNCLNSAGDTACSNFTDAGSVALPVSVNSHVGNPINFATGNKYHRETDYLSKDSRLDLVRHYNSQKSHIDIGMGSGWSMTYLLQLKRLSITQMLLTQSDGREILFTRVKSVNNSAAIVRYDSVLNSDGYIEAGKKYRRWVSGTGRITTFRGPFPVSIKWPDNQRVDILYKNDHVQSISNSINEKLLFHYSANPGYQHQISAIELPDGSLLSYRYIESKLANVTRDSQILRSYHYEDTKNKNLITGISTRDQGRISSYEYDSSGVPIRSYNFQDQQYAKIEYQRKASSTTNRKQYTHITITGGRGEKGIFLMSNPTDGSPYTVLESHISLCNTCYTQSSTFKFDQTFNLQEFSKNNSDSKLPPTHVFLVKKQPVPYGRADNQPVGLENTIVTSRSSAGKILELADNTEHAILVQYSVFGTILKIEQHINELSFTTASSDQTYLANKRNFHAASAAHSVNKAYSLEAAVTEQEEKCSLINSPFTVTLPEEIKVDPGNEQKDECKSSETSQLKPSFPLASFRNATATNCVSYFDLYHGTHRGFEIEDGFAHHNDFASALSTVRNFPVVDFLQNRTALAIISRDLTAASYHGSIPDAVYDMLVYEASEISRKFLEPMDQHGYVSARESGLTSTISSGDFDSLVMEVVIQHGTASESQQRQLALAKALIEASSAIKVRIVEIP